MIPLSVPNLKGNELEYVTRAVKSEWVSTGGAFVSEFENCLAAYCGANGGVACQNGTSGLHIALMLCGVQRDEEVIVPTLTFIAAVNPVRYIGAEPVFMDCDDSLCMDPDKLEEFCAEECKIHENILINKKTGRTIRAVIVVHVFGNMAQMERFIEIGKRYHLKIIEDATEALGTYYTQTAFQGKFSGTIGDIGVYSFNGNKIITTGGGGMIVSMNQEWLYRAKHLTTQAKVDEQNFIHDEVGYNYRLTNLQAALGLAQLEQLEKFIQIKKRNYEYYQCGVRKIDGLSFLSFQEGTRPNYWFYSLFCGDNFPMNCDTLIRFLLDHDIQTRPIWGLIHEQKPYQNCWAYRIERAQYYHQHIINVPCSTNLTQEQIDKVLFCLQEAAKK